MNIKPFYAVVFLYFIANFLCLILTLFNNNILSMEFMDFHIETSVLFFAFSLQFFSLLFLIFIYSLFKNKNFSEQYFYGNFSGLLLLIWQFLFLIFALIWGLGVIGGDNKASQILVMISNFISADILYFLIAPSLKSDKLFSINTIIYLSSTLIRGWLGGVLIAFFVYLCRIGGLKISLKAFLLYSVLLVTLVLISPFLIDLKVFIRTNGDLDFNVDDYGLKLEAAINYLLGRFQHIGHTALLINSSEEYRKLYDMNKILPYWLEGIPQNFMYKFLGNHELLTYSNVMAIRDFGAYSNEAWNANTGLSGWLVLLREKSIFLLTYWSLLLFSFFYFVRKYANRQTFNIISVFTIIYLFHGWFGAFFNLIILTFIIVFLKKIKLSGV